MVAPKVQVISFAVYFKKGNGVPALVAVHQDATGTALHVALAYAKGVRCTRAGVIETTFQKKPKWIYSVSKLYFAAGNCTWKAGFETLTEGGYRPEIAYFECLHELKLIVDLMYEGGLTICAILFQIRQSLEIM